MKSTRRIGLILALVFLLPALFFSVYEISSLNKEQEMIQDIYNKQLDAILFSVNQYSDDIMSSWISRIESGQESASAADTIPAKIKDLLLFNSSLPFVFMSDTASGKAALKVFSVEEGRKDLSKKIDSALLLNRAQINQLVGYKENGFQKVDVLRYEWPQDMNLQCLVFITGNATGKLYLIGLLIDPEIFVQEIIGPRLQTIARDQFILSTFRKGTQAPVYSTLVADSLALSAESLTKDLWLFPDYTLGIRTKSMPLRDVIRERTANNLILLISLDVILVVAVVLVFRNVKREVQLAQNKSDFISNVSHEIRTPLALISMFAETLDMGRVISEEKRQEYYRIISKETNRLSGIVNKILNFSQTEANKKTLNPEPVNVVTAIDEILSTYDFHLKNKGFEYTFTGEPDLWIKADKEAFVEAVINLIDNAVKYSIDQKRIEVTTGRQDGFGYVKIKDEGIGISLADQKYIFDKFYRVSTGDLAKSRGTGLGLSLVKQLMEIQKGQVTVFSEPGKGSVFTLYFPIEKPAVNG
jgi:two-component system, OmpR family, phosphate regulon sensor histidine kinase PhoR